MSKYTERHFEERDSLQRTKHHLLEAYLNAWYPIMSSRNRRIAIFDLYAGKGRFESGEPGSPLVALNTLLAHSHLPTMVMQTEFRFFFVEADPESVESLERSVEDAKQDDGFPGDRISIDVVNADSEEVLAALIERYDGTAYRIAPSFFFIDPFGFKLHAELFRRVLALPRTEILLTLMWRHANMGRALTHRAPGMIDTLSGLFGGPDWTSLNDPALDDEHRADLATDILGRNLHVKWTTSLKLRDQRGGIKYCLVHFTNHDAGRQKMKDAIWHIGPNDHWVWRAKDAPDKGLELDLDIGTDPVESWLVDQLRDGPKTKEQLYRRLLGAYWKRSTLHDALRELCRKNEVRVIPPQPHDKIKLKRINLIELVD
jgi:three-Cys-motif partner protein